MTYLIWYILYCVHPCCKMIIDQLFPCYQKLYDVFFCSVNVGMCLFGFKLRMIISCQSLHQGLVPLEV